MSAWHRPIAGRRLLESGCGRRIFLKKKRPTSTATVTCQERLNSRHGFGRRMESWPTETDKTRDYEIRVTFAESENDLTRSDELFYRHV